jgi:uncharacterized protein (TIGR00730 family)
MIRDGVRGYKGVQENGYCLVMKICVFLSSGDLDERYTGPAREFATLVGDGGHSLVWGGSDSGLMKVIADGVRASGGRLTGISVRFLAKSARTDVDEMTFAEDLAERKALLLAASDAVVVMAGGVGTLDELTEVLELKKHGLYDRPVVLLNTAGFYDGLISQLRRMEGEGFLPVPLSDLVFIADTGAEALGHLENAAQGIARHNASSVPAHALSEGGA